MSYVSEHEKTLISGTKAVLEPIGAKRALDFSVCMDLLAQNWRLSVEHFKKVNVAVLIRYVNVQN